MTVSRYDRVLKWVLVITGILLIFMILSLFSRSSVDTRISGNGPRVGVVEIEGIIVDSERTVDQLDQFSRRRDIEAILVRINSAGGLAAASQEIYEKLRRVRDEGTKPVIASLGTVAASGGYYVALGADTIIASPGTTTGSIGVILDYPVAADLMEQLGLQVEVIQSGSLKDAGSPFRTPTEEDRRSFQRVVDDMYDQFTEVVAKERGLSSERVGEVATGEVFTGRQALGLGLVDLLGGYEDAVDLAGQLAGSLERPVVIKPVEQQRISLWDILLGDSYQQIWLAPQLLPQYLMR